MKLNGWIRIGVIASVVWMVGAGLSTFREESELDDRVFEASERACLSFLDSYKAIYTHCIDTASNYRMSQLPGERLNAGLVAIIPVPVAWGLAYLILFLVRWVKLGFAK